MLKELCKQDSKWREIALEMCGDKFLADDIVNEMYLRRYENNRGQQISEYYIVSTMYSILRNFQNVKKPKRIIYVDELYETQTTDERFEADDNEKKLLENVSELSYRERELLELSYNYSLRDIESIHDQKIDYGYIYRTNRSSREKILGIKIHKYKSKRVRYLKKTNKMDKSISENIDKAVNSWRDKVDKLKKEISIKIENRDYSGAAKLKTELITLRKCINDIDK